MDCAVRIAHKIMLVCCLGARHSVQVMIFLLLGSKKIMTWTECRSILAYAKRLAVAFRCYLLYIENGAHVHVHQQASDSS